MPKVSVIVAVYNGERFLSETIDSLRNQSLTDIEMIFVDDGSTDGTPRLLNAAANGDSRLKVFSPGRVGQAKAFNLGIDFASGEWIARCDADDLALPARLSSQVAFLERHPEIGICGSAAMTFGNGPERRLRFPEFDSDIRSQLLFNCCLCHSSVMFRRSSLDTVRYRSEFGEACDYDLWANAAWSGVKLHNLPDVLVKYRIHANSVTLSTGPRQQLFTKAIRRWQLERFGIVPTEEELQLHSLIGNHSFASSREFVLAARAWLESLHERDLQSPLAISPTFTATLRRYWYAVCSSNRQLGSWVIRQYFASPLGKGCYGKCIRLLFCTLFKN